jgi:hypothetical protein
MGSAPATPVDSNLPHGLVPSDALEPTGEGAGWNTRGHVCTPFSTASFRRNDSVGFCARARRHFSQTRSAPDPGCSRPQRRQTSDNFKGCLAKVAAGGGTPELHTAFGAGSPTLSRECIPEESRREGVPNWCLGRCSPPDAGRLGASSGSSSVAFQTVVEAVAGHRGKFQPGRAGIQ